MSTKDITLRSSAAEYLTFIASEGEREDRVEIRYEEENIWLTQKAMAQLYDVTAAAINQHIKKIFTDKELDEQAVIKKYLITANDGKHYQANHYNLQIEKYRVIQDKEYISDFDKFSDGAGGKIAASCSFAQTKRDFRCKGRIFA